MKKTIVMLLALVFAVPVFAQDFVPENASFEQAVFNNNVKEAAYYLDKVKENKRTAMIDKAPSKKTLTFLSKSASEGNLDMVKFLVESGADVNVKNYDNTSALAIAVDAKKDDIAEYLISTGKISQDSFSLSFFAAVLSGDDAIKKMEYLMQKGGDITHDPSSSLFYALKTNRMDIVDFMISKGVDVNARGANGVTALMGAAGRKDLDQVKYLIGKGARINAITNKRQTVLMFASGSYEVTKYLLEQGADASITDDIYLTPLFYAVDKLNIQAADLFLKAGNPPDKKSINGSSALLSAAQNNNLDMVKFLVEHGATVYVKNANGLYPYRITNNKEVGEYLKAQDVIQKKTKPAQAKYTPFMEAVNSNDFDAVKQMVESGADVNERVFAYNMTGPFESPLMLAAKNFEMAKYLIDKGAFVRGYDDKGANVFFYAVKASNTELVQYLMDKWGFTVNDAAFNMVTPLFYAAENNDMEMIKFLVEKGADINIKSGGKKTASDMTTSKEIKKYLKEQGALQKKAAEEKLKAEKKKKA